MDPPSALFLHTHFFTVRRVLYGSRANQARVSHTLQCTGNCYVYAVAAPRIALYHLNEGSNPSPSSG